MYSFKVLRQSGFLLLLTAALWLVFLYGRVLSTPILALIWVAAWSVMTRGLLARARVRRQAWLAVYLRPSSSYGRLLRGGIVMTLVCATVAALLSLFLLMTLMRKDDALLWQALLVTACLLLPAQQLFARRLITHFNERYLPELAWRFVALFVGLCLVAFLGWHAFHQQYPNLLNATLEQSVWHFVDAEAARSPYLLALLQLSAALDGLTQWLAQQLLPAPVNSFTQASAWILLLVRESLFVWSFLIMCRGVLVLHGSDDRNLEQAV